MTIFDTLRSLEIRAKHPSISRLIKSLILDLTKEFGHFERPLPSIVGINVHHFQKSSAGDAYIAAVIEEIFSKLVQTITKMEGNGLEIGACYHPDYIDQQLSYIFPIKKQQLDKSNLLPSIIGYFNDLAQNQLVAMLSTTSLNIPEQPVNMTPDQIQLFRSEILSYFIAPLMQMPMAIERRDLPRQVILRRLDGLAHLLATGVTTCIAISYDHKKSVFVIGTNDSSSEFNSEETKRLVASIKIRLSLIDTLCDDFCKVFGEKTVGQMCSMPKVDRLSRFKQFLLGGKASLRCVDSEETEQPNAKEIFLIKRSPNYWLRYAIEQGGYGELQITSPTLIKELNNISEINILIQHCQDNNILSHLNRLLIESQAPVLISMIEHRLAPFIRGGVITTADTPFESISNKLSKIMDMFIFSNEMSEKYSLFNRAQALQCAIILVPSAPPAAAAASASASASANDDSYRPSNFHAEQLIMRYFINHGLELSFVALNKLLCLTCWGALNACFPNAVVSGTSLALFPNVYDLINGNAGRKPADVPKTLIPMMYRTKSDDYSPPGTPPSSTYSCLQPRRGLFATSANQERYEISAYEETNTNQYIHVDSPLRRSKEILLLMSTTYEDGQQQQSAAAAAASAAAATGVGKISMGFL